MIEYVLHPGVTSGELMGIILPMLPSILVFALPMALLVGVQIGVGRMVMDREVLAMRTSGVNLLKVFAPAMGAGFLVSLAILWLSWGAIPAMIEHSLMRVAQLQFKMIKALEPGVVHDSLPGGGSSELALYYRERDDKTLEGVFLKMTRERESDAEKWTEEAGHPVRAEEDILILAQSGEIEASIDHKHQMGALALTLKNGTIHRLDADPGNPQYVITHFDKFRKNIVKSSKIEKRNKTYSVPELRERIAGQRARLTVSDHAMERIGMMRREIFERISMAWAALVFMIVGIPLAIQVRVSGKSWSILVAIALMVVYYVSMKFGLAMIQSNHSMGVFMAFCPNILYAVLGAALWWRVLRS